MILRIINHWNKLKVVDSRNRKYDLIWLRILCPNWWCSLTALEKLSSCLYCPPLRNVHSHRGYDVKARPWPRHLPFPLTPLLPFANLRQDCNLSGASLQKNQLLPHSLLAIPIQCLISNMSHIQHVSYPVVDSWCSIIVQWQRTKKKIKMQCDYMYDTTCNIYA